jgi:BirA family transcriptional regulator, biotin operon repressor / biotin---[acetyl-CoA-carboxylase] ligase
MTNPKNKSRRPVDAQILRSLREGDSISGADLAQWLGISRAAIWARIEELRRLGYEISASPHDGYRLIRVPDVLHADDLLSRLPEGGVVGRDIRVFSETTSTNDVMERMVRDGVEEGMAVFAETQTKGRGRLGRKWVSPPGKGLWFSVLLRPNLRPVEATQLTVAAATALCRAVVAQTGLEPEIKWPNDLLIGGKKAAGILTEMRAELDRVRYVILGIGVDVNLNAGEFPSDLRSLATSLKIELGKAVDRAELAAALLTELDRDYARVCRGQFGAVADEWESRCSTLGHNIVLQVGQRTLHGRAESLDEDGALLLRTQHGHLERIIGGDVTMER